MTTFLLIRHAEHAMGMGTLAGRTPDVPLSREGYEQADALARRLAEVRIDALYSSPILRCRETAERIAPPHGLEITTAEELIEIDFGDWQGRTVASLEPEDGWRRFNAFRSGVQAPGGDLYLEVQLRVVRFMLDLRPRHEGQTVALVLHADPLRAALLHFLGIPMDLFLRLEIGPASVSVLTLDEWGPRVLGVNHTGDLPKLA